ncbi:MAG: family 43 glycosylhydrolase [Clostridia bacterium]|nr:family 43 glycosylhydrolase [Clostridia bacterium]
MKLSDINIRDPFILTHEGKYYMYGTRAKYTWDYKGSKYNFGFDVYVSDDLENWSEPIPVFEYYDGFIGVKDFWAPEVHKYNGKFYMFATFHPENAPRGTAILVSNAPDGKFELHSDGLITPKDWSSLDGTFYEENGTPYMVFCHEWTQIKNGAVCAVELSKDLTRAVGEPFKLWSAGDATWKYDIKDYGAYVTDGPFLVKQGDTLLSIWSSFYKGEYCEAIARSDNGSILGNWTIDDKLIYENGGGHGMIFKDLQGKDNFVFHQPNETPKERPAFVKISIEDLINNR